MTTTPWSRRVRTTSKRLCVSFWARALVGSSSISTLGEKLMALVISTTWHCHMLNRNTFSWGSMSTFIFFSRFPAIS